MAMGNMSQIITAHCKHCWQISSGLGDVIYEWQGNKIFLGDDIWASEIVSIDDDTYHVSDDNCFKVVGVWAKLLFPQVMYSAI